MNIQVLVDFKNRKYLYDVIENNNQILSAITEPCGQCINGEITINENKQKYKIITSSREEAIFPANPMTTLTFTHKILASNKFWGEIAYCNSSNSKIPSGYKIETKNNKYNVFPIYMGKEGLKMPVYLNDEQIGLIENKEIIKNNSSAFNIFIPENEINEEYIIVCTMACMFHNFERYFNNGKPYYTRFGWTTKKCMKEKYIKTFKNN